MGRKKSRSRGPLARKTFREKSFGEKAPAEENGEAKAKEVEDSNSEVPMDVYSRLTYPLVRDETTEEEESEEEGEETVELNFQPRLVFVAGLCPVCTETSRVRCDSCRTVSYCSIKHREQGYAKHRDLCDALAKCIAVASRSRVRTEKLSAEQYRVYRIKLLERLELQVGRPLELWEREIVLYPPFCRTCRNSAEQELARCTICAMDFFCEEHATEHGKYCLEFQVFRRCLSLQLRHGYVDPALRNCREPRPLRVSENSFDSLMSRVYRGSAYYKRMDCHTYSTLSQLSTVPLTALYSAQMACPSWETASDLTIHIIGAEFQFECINLRAWEHLFLHFLPNLKKLRLVFVGPELRLPGGVPAELLGRVKLCSACRASGVAIGVSFYPETLYHEIGRSTRPADLLCLFNPGLYRETAFQGRDTWPETIRALDIQRIKAISDVEMLLEPRPNPFASVKPDRNFVSDDTAPLIYKNYYLAIVKGKAVC